MSATNTTAHPRRVYKTSEFIGVAVLALSVVLQKVFPLHEPTILTSTTCQILGVVLVLAAAWILRQVHAELAKYKQPHEPGIPTTRLVTTGPFQYSRNPTYTAIVVLMQPGLALTFWNVWMLLLLPGQTFPVSHSEKSACSATKQVLRHGNAVFLRSTYVLGLSISKEHTNH